tara:strand:+ start:4260 stop:4898 length:639 start_codon:yes stop_codon:yes gene_type:complete
MKHIKLFEQFINEAYSSDKVKDEIVKLFIKAGFPEPRIGSSSISTILPNDTMKAPVEIVKLEKEIKKWAKSNDGVLTTKTAVGYSSGNDFSVMIASGSVNVSKVYHKTARKNADIILKNGMSAREANGHSDTFGAGLSGSNSTEQLYSATFAVTSIGAARKLDQYFDFGDDPVILEINGKGYSWMPDPLMPPDMKSVFTYDDIKAEDISIKE